MGPHGVDTTVQTPVRTRWPAGVWPTSGFIPVRTVQTSIR